MGFPRLCPWRPCALHISNPKRNYVTQWNLNLQYQLTPNLSAMVAYVGSRGVHQPFRVDEASAIENHRSGYDIY